MAATIPDAEARIRALRASEQQELALALATLIEPVAGLSVAGQPKDGLAAVAEEIRAARDEVAVDRARRHLFDIPELLMDEEPEGDVWFAYSVTIAWIYAADSKCTAPSDGAVNALRRTLEVLDALDADQQGLVDEALVRLDAPASLEELRPSIEAAVSRVQSGSAGGRT